MLYALYINTYVFYFFKQKSYNKGDAALDSDYGWHLTFMSTEAIIMLTTFAVVE